MEARKEARRRRLNHQPCGPPGTDVRLRAGTRQGADCPDPLVPPGPLAVRRIAPVIGFPGGPFLIRLETALGEHVFLLSRGRVQRLAKLLGEAAVRKAAGTTGRVSTKGEGC